MDGERRKVTMKGWRKGREGWRKRGRKGLKHDNAADVGWTGCGGVWRGGGGRGGGKGRAGQGEAWKWVEEGIPQGTGCT